MVLLVPWGVATRFGEKALVVVGDRSAAATGRPHSIWQRES